MDFIHINEENRLIINVQSLRQTLESAMTLYIKVSPNDDTVLITTEKEEPPFYERADDQSLMKELIEECERLEKEKKSLLQINDVEFQQFYYMIRNMLSTKQNGASIGEIKTQSSMSNITNSKRQYFMKILLRNKFVLKVDVNETKKYFLPEQLQ